MRLGRSLRESKLTCITQPLAAADAWSNRLISTDEFVWLLNSFEGRTFSDSSRGSMLGFTEIVRSFFPNGLPPLENTGHIGDIEFDHVCQLVQLKSPGNHVEFAGNEIVTVRQLEHIVQFDSPFRIEIHKRSSSLRMRQLAKVLVFSKFDELWAFASSLTVSQNELFIVADFTIGITRVFLIRSSNKGPSDLVFLSDFSFPKRAKSAISGYFMIVASAYGNSLILWEIIGGRIYRVFEFDREIRKIMADEQKGFWLVMDERILFLSIDGDICCSVDISIKVTALAVVPLFATEIIRSAFVGTEDGSLYLLNARVQEAAMDWKQLLSEHRCEICSIAIGKSLKEFISVDANNCAFLWNAIGLAPGNSLKGLQYSCAFCGDQDTVLDVCVSCGRTLCERCRWRNDGSRMECAVCFWLT
jgi:WD40 repeat protein